jgi:hypothetical protein
MESTHDLRAYLTLVSRARASVRQMESGFLDLAEVLNQIHRTRLYRVRYPTFAAFCEAELGFTRETLYADVSILKLVTGPPPVFSRARAVEFGHRKMRTLTRGVDAIEKAVDDRFERTRRKRALFQRVVPSMAPSEIESIVDETLADLRRGLCKNPTSTA